MAGQVTFTPTEGDYVAANRLALRHSKIHRRMPWLGFAALAIAGSIVASDLTRGWALAAALNDALVPLAVGAMLLGLPFFWRWQVPRTVAKQFVQRPEMGAPVELKWSTEQLTLVSASGSTVQRWRTLHQWLADDATFMLLLTERLMLPIPRRALSTEDWADLIATAEQQAPPAG